jgi:peroxiredoxin
VKNTFLFLVTIITIIASPLHSATIASSADKITPLLVGNQLPTVKLKDYRNKSVDLEELSKGKSTLVVFYRGSWCPYCNRHLQALGESKASLEKMGIQIIAISPDSASSLSKSLEKNKVDYTLLSDAQVNAAKAFGVAFNSGRRGTLPVPSVFLFDSKGTLSFQYVNPNYKVRLDKGVLMAAAKAISK